MSGTQGEVECQGEDRTKIRFELKIETAVASFVQSSAPLAIDGHGSPHHLECCDGFAFMRVSGRGAHLIGEMMGAAACPQGVDNLGDREAVVLDLQPA